MTTPTPKTPPQSPRVKLRAAIRKTVTELKKSKYWHHMSPNDRMTWALRKLCASARLPTAEVSLMFKDGGADDTDDTA